MSEKCDEDEDEDDTGFAPLPTTSCHSTLRLR